MSVSKISRVEIINNRYLPINEFRIQKMMNKRIVNSALAVLALGCFLCPSTVWAALEWSLDQNISLPSDVRDVVESPDGQRLFVLTGEGNILVLNNEGQMVESIEGSFSADQIRVSSDGGKLLLYEKGKKSLQVVSLIERAELPIADSPIKGDPDVPVALVVFSDFQ